ncbi:DNA-binding transcriptional regulator, LysR family [Pseudomonas sp. IT-P74]|uniref:LysR family transcriptional regulator n=1 Tax=Pseudomonas sp. IT-P74 TaxID=3026445 RepID=UPI0039E03413
MELRQLKQVLVLAETLNFHRAAEQLHMAQPPLSTSIKKLETELGVLLFERLPSGLKLTPAGEAVLHHSRRTLFCADEIRRAAREGLSGEQGRLRVGIVGSASFSLMPCIIRSYRREFPGVELHIEESTTSDLLRRLDEHTLDVALVRWPVLEPSKATITLLQRERLVLAVSSDSSLARRDDLQLAQLGSEPFIIHSRTRVPTLHALTLYAFQSAGIQPPIAQEAVQVQTILGLVEAGMGVALLPESVCAHAGSRVVFKPLGGLSDTLLVGTAVAVLTDSVTPVARHFVEHVLRIIVPPQDSVALEG